MKNLVQTRGDTITVPASANTTGGEVVVIGSLKGVAAGDAAIGEALDVVTVGVFELPKVGVNVFAIGAPVYYDAGDKLVTSDPDSGANQLIGIAVTAAANPSATVRVKLG